MDEAGRRRIADLLVGVSLMAPLAPDEQWRDACPWYFEDEQKETVEAEE